MYKVCGVPKKRITSKQNKLFAKDSGKLGVSWTANLLLRGLDAFIKGQGGAYSHGTLLKLPWLACNSSLGVAGH